MAIPLPAPVLDDQVSSLRQELKVWEKEFVAANGGRKAGRDDIKKNAVIAAKYKEYDRLRRPQVTKPDPRPTKPSTYVQPLGEASDKQTQPIAATPRKNKSRSEVHPFPDATKPATDKEVVHEDDEEDEIEPTPAAVRMQLGPTPLKDGQILSLFDCLSAGTPSKPRSALNTIEANIAATPSKSNRVGTTIAESPAIENARGSRTPASSGKRFMLDTFATPLKRKREDDETHGTPSSSMKLLATPAFLRRSNTMSIMDTLAEEAEQDGELLNLTRTRGPPFKKKKGFIRSLSSIIQGMRKQEDDFLDEELDIMNEMENEVDAGQAAPLKRPSQDSRKLDTAPEPEIEPEVEQDDEEGEEAEVVIEDSQVVMPLGPDQLPEFSDDEDEEDDGHNGRVRKPWKKKGQKRQTKRTNMRPVTHKSKTVQPSTELDNHVNNESVAETQLPASDIQEDHPDDPDYSDTEINSQHVHDKPHADLADAASKQNEGPIKKAARKISAQAHANFRRLKIRNQNSKAKGKGRFGRK